MSLLISSSRDENESVRFSPLYIEPAKPAQVDGDDEADGNIAGVRVQFYSPNLSAKAFLKEDAIATLEGFIRSRSDYRANSADRFNAFEAHRTDDPDEAAVAYRFVANLAKLDDVIKQARLYLSLIHENKYETWNSADPFPGEPDDVDPDPAEEFALTSGSDYSSAEEDYYPSLAKSMSTPHFDAYAKDK